MSERPSMQSAQRFLVIGVLVGILLGCVAGAALVGLYIRQYPPVYEGGAYPVDLTDAYQEHYIAMVVDSYLVNQEPQVARERLKTFSDQAQIRSLAGRSAAYVAAGRGAEAQLINNLAVALKGVEGWSEETIKAVVTDLASQYQDDPARSQAISTFSAVLLEGQVPVPSEVSPPEEGPPAATVGPPSEAPPAAVPAPGFSWTFYLLCCLLLLVVLLIIYIIGRRRFEARRLPTRQEIEWEGEGAPPLKVWSGTYTLGHDTYDEFFTIETEDNVFLGECGMGILETVPNTSDPKQVLAFDVGLFDKTDITTLSRAVMSEYAYNDDTLRAKIEANPQAEAILAEPGKEFSFETTALRVDAKIDDMAYAEGGNKYFETLSVTLQLFLKEGADLRQGEMDVPEEFQQ